AALGVLGAAREALIERRPAAARLATDRLRARLQHRHVPLRGILVRECQLGIGRGAGDVARQALLPLERGRDPRAFLAARFFAGRPRPPQYHVVLAPRALVGSAGTECKEDECGPDL